MVTNHLYYLTGSAQKRLTSGNLRGKVVDEQGLRLFFRQSSDVFVEQFSWNRARQRSSVALEGQTGEETTRSHRACSKQTAN